MYRNFQNNQLFTKEVGVIFTDKAMFKTITDKNNIQRNLFSFYVNDDGQNIKCVTWNETADNLNKLFNKDTKTIEIKYLHKNNKNTDELEYSVREFNIIN